MAGWMNVELLEDGWLDERLAAGKWLVDEGVAGEIFPAGERGLA